MNDIRLPLFLFAVADELPLSFFPLFTKAAINPITWLDPAIVISLPLAGYLFAYMVASPFSRSLSEKWGYRKLLLLSLLPVILSNFGMFFATNVIEIILLRTIAGAGYALAVLACQDYVMDMVVKEHRTKSLGIFSTALFGGIFAGTALGGVLADRFGPSSVFLVSTIIVVLSALLFYKMIPPGRHKETEEKEDLSLKLILQSLKHRPFFAIVLGLAVPQSIMDQVFISYIFSLQLDLLHASAADIARMLMIYFLMIMISGSLLGGLKSLRISTSMIVLVGSTLTAGVLMIAAFMPGQWSMLLAAVGTGFGHGLVRGPQVDLSMHQAETELSHLGSSSVLGALRVLERLGSILGLILIAGITGYFGLAAAIGTIGTLVFIGMILFSSQNLHALSFGLKTGKR
ncbi:MAG: MFS transporter [Sneathiella sp.]|nr:MFS transporter [Sneathiella sp.]